MQTLKTAAIVVLVMTVIYGAYVSLTTPPEPLPADVMGIIEIDPDGSVAVDVGLPESLETLGINQPAASAADPPSGVAPPPLSGITTTLTDQPSVAIGQPVQAPTQAPVATPGQTPASTPIESLAASTVPNYPSTNRSFELPDPSTVISSFEGQNVGPNGNLDDATNSHLALASGTSDSQSNGNPPSTASVQNPDLPTAGITPNVGLTNAIRNADMQYVDDKRRDALATLSLFYNTPNLSGEQRSELLSRLDPLAREVIYSKRHLLEQPHRVGQNETLMEIASRYDVPWQLLANINQISDPVTILPGTELKVVRGPFRAEVNLTANELTLFLGDLYAGRFPIAIGNDPAPSPGTYTVQDKQTSKTFYNHAGSPVVPGSPDNPYGNVWIDLGSQVCIHGSPSTTSGTNKGCISLAADYADDLYGILSQGSSVTIRR